MLILQVGTGTVGYVLAHHLSEPGEYSVFLVKSGQDDRHWVLQIPAGLRSAFEPSLKYKYTFKTTLQVNLNGRQIDQLCDNTLRGYSSIDGMTFCVEILETMMIERKRKSARAGYL